MRRRTFSISLLSTLSTLPVAAQQVFALAADAAGAQERDFHTSLLSAQPQPAGTVALLPIGYEKDTFALAPVTHDGKMLTRSVSFDVTPPFLPQYAARVTVPVLKRQSFPFVEGPHSLFEGTVDFGPEIGVLPYSVVALDPDRAWTAKGVRASAAGEPMTVRAINGDDAPLIITEWLGVSSLEVFVSPALRRLLEQRGVDVDEISESAVVPNLRQRVVPLREGLASFQVPDPPLMPEMVQMLETIQVTLWSPVPLTVLEREG